MEKTSILASFCPDEVIRFFWERAENEKEEQDDDGMITKLNNSAMKRKRKANRRKKLRLTEPLIMDPHDAVVLWIDICKFTSLAEKLPPTKLGKSISDFFSMLIERIVAHGGDVLKFCGDALLCSFRDANNQYNSEQIGIDASVLSACQCALEIQSLEFSFENIQFQVRTSIALGTCHAMLVGGTRDRWEYLVTGDPLRHIRVASADRFRRQPSEEVPS